MRQLASFNGIIKVQKTIEMTNEQRTYDVKDASIEDLWWKYVEEDTLYLSNEVKWLEDNKSCPVCNSTNSTPLFKKTNFNYVACNACTHIYFSKKISEEGMDWYHKKGKALRHWNRTYEQQISYRSKLAEERAFRFLNDVSESLRVISGGINILEIGAGTGDFAQALSKLLAERNIKHEIHIFEPQVDSPIAKINGGSIHVHPKKYEKINKLNFDFIIMNEVIEHIPNPKILLGSVKESASKNAILYMTTPNTSSLEFMLLNSDSPMFGFDHCSLFSIQSMKELLQKTGWLVKDITTPGKRDCMILMDHFTKKDLPVNDYLTKTLAKESEAIKNIQTIISENLLSSHMRIMACRS